MEQLKNHLKNFIVKELKEVIAVKKGFQVSKLKRADLENVILLNHTLFRHLLNKKKAKPLTKTKAKTKTLKTNTQELNNKIDLYAELIKPSTPKASKPNSRITKLLDKVDKKALRKRIHEYSEPIDLGMIISKKSKRYTIRDEKGDPLLSTESRKEVEKYLSDMDY